MTNLTENSVWESGIYQLETDDPTLGGPPGFNLGEPVTGHANAQAQQLSNRTKYLKDTHEAFVSDLANATDPAKGAGMVGFKSRTAVDRFSDSVHIGDFADLVTVGAYGDDWTAALQAALDTKLSVYVPNVIDIYDQVHFRGASQELIGRSKYKSGIRQRNASAGAISIQPVDDPVSQGNNLVLSPAIRKMSIIGAGKGVATGVGVYVGGGSSTYNGDWMTLDSVQIRGFGTCLETYSIGQVRFVNTNIAYATGDGWKVHGGSANSYAVLGLSIGRCDVGLRMLSGVGGVLILGDLNNNDTADIVVDFATVTIMGGNCESSPRVVIAQNGADVTIVGQRPLRNGKSVAPYEAVGNSKIVLVNCKQASPVAGTPLAEKTGATSVIEMIGCEPYSSNALPNTTNGADVMQSGQLIRGLPFPQRYHNAVPAAASGLRGLILQSVGVSGTAADALYYYAQNRDGTVVRESILNGDARVTVQTTATGSAASNTRYRTTAASQIDLVLPSSPSIDDEIEMFCVGAGGGRLVAATGHVIHDGTSVTLTGGAITVGQWGVVRIKYASTNNWIVVFKNGPVSV